MVYSEDIFEAFVELGYILEDPNVIDRLCLLCDKYEIDEKKLSCEYLTFATKKKYQAPSFEILVQFEKEIFYTTKKSSTENDKKIAENKDNPEKVWCIGDFSRVVCEFDGLEHEVEILSQHPSNPEIYRVKVLGYEHKEVKNQTLLKESFGELARKAQIEKNATKLAAGIKKITTHPTHNESAVSADKQDQRYLLSNGQKPSKNLLKFFGPFTLHFMT